MLIEGVSMVKRHTRPNPQKQIKGGIAERESAIAISNVMVLTVGRRGHAGRLSDGRQGRVTAVRVAKKGGEILDKKAVRINMARLKELYLKTVVPALTKEFDYKNPMAVPKIEKISLNIGMGEATQNSKLMDGAVNELTADRRTEAGDHQGAQIDRGVQAARGHAHRLHGDAARRPHVRISGPPGERGAAPRARFPRRFDQVLRRPRQLHAGH